ncbi:cytoplasmic tRNA 2-thiolation protein 1-like [Ruditapes philippinarum]|uniref:cytoplasmic tRNA 2-thiolation protein 1-like n=1 Tax=Ruditapes philippinarum TaxID=129788 RepID=UPI00295A9945|nr:cytoplasmic tRNA 2-thiolation protein 1-like [Ruditapes philippinarum]
MPIKCNICGKSAILKRPKTGDALCKECFYYAFEEEIHKTIIDASLFTRGETIAIGASGGKDSTVLAYILKLLNDRHDYGVKLVLLSVDEGITGYRDDSLETVKRNQKQYDLPLKIISYEELYGWTMDAIVKQIGLKNNCTFCGVFRRQALDRGALLLKVDKIATGHNADDIAETVIMNVLRGDIGRLRRCTAITTGTDGALPRCKPFKYTYEKEIVMYAYFKNLDYFSTECIYSPNAYRGFARAYIKDVEKIRSSAIIDIIHSGESLSVKKEVRMPVQGVCERCGYISSNPVCKACVMLEGLNKGLPRLGIGKTHKERRKMEQMLSDKASDLESSTSGSLSDMSSLDSAISCKLDCDRSNCCCQVNKDQSEGSELPNNDSSGCCKKTASQSGCNEDVDKSCDTNSAGNAVALEKLSVFNRKIDKAVIDF